MSSGAELSIWLSSRSGIIHCRNGSRQRRYKSRRLSKTSSNVAGRIPGISVKIPLEFRQFSRNAVFRSFSLFAANLAVTVANPWELELAGFPGSVSLPLTVKKSNELLFPSNKSKQSKMLSSSRLDLLTTYVSVL